MADADGRPHGRLGRLFAALVGNDDAGAGAPGGAAAPGDTRDDNTSVLDLDALCRRLMSTGDPLGALRDFMRDVRERVRATEGPAAGGGAMGGAASPEASSTSTLPPSAFELYLATRLAEAGLGEDDVALPAVRAIRTRNADLIYLRVDDTELSWPAKVRLLRVESAVNAAILADELLPDANAASFEELVRAEQRVARSITSQARSVASGIEGPVRGEWSVRTAISTGIECFRLPHRLEASFRVNVAAGTAAIEASLVPPRAWASSAFVDGLGVVPATVEMRRRAATDYNLRLLVLLAGYALMVAPELDEAWVAGVVDTASLHACYCSARVTRAAMARVDLEGPLDPVALMRALGAELREDARTLVPVRQTFSLDDERFCPAWRHDPVELSALELGPEAAHALGCARVRDLAVDEARARRQVADELVRRLGSSTEANVRALLELARGEAPEDVCAAARRCVSELIEGTLADEPVAIAEALVAGDPLTRALERAREAQRRGEGAQTAERIVREALSPIDEAGAYEDGNGISWRCFGSYTERALYNRVAAIPGETCRLVSSAYVEAHLALSACALVDERLDDAVHHAKRACLVAPMSAQASLGLAQTLEAAGDAAGAVAELRRLLLVTSDPEAIGMAYLRLSQLQWREGHVLVAQACYQRARERIGAPLVLAGLAVAALLGQVGTATGGGELSAEEASRALDEANIPLAPTDEVGDALAEATVATMDMGLFGPARDLMRSLCALVRDDITFGVLRSLDDEPDR